MNNLKILVISFMAMMCFVPLIGQSDYFGAGNDAEIKVTTSDNYQRTGWSQSSAGENTINGDGLYARLLETSRFLSQAAMGASISEIESISEMDYEEWMDEQMDAPSSSMLVKLMSTYDEVYDAFVMNGGDTSNFGGPNWLHFHYAWWDEMMKTEEMLRQRVAFSLSEILIISSQTELGSFGDGLASYYDILLQNAFGNYQDILMQVTLHPCMGFYLSHLNNPKAIPAENISPDENYAREVLQLFSIGLYELNQDGSRRLDGNGDFIPTYDQSTIDEFAKIFTGLGVSEIRENPWVDSAQFDLNIYVADMTKPMKVYEDWHQLGEKDLLNGFTVPAGQGGLKDIQDAVQNIFDHENVGPFIGRLLIQRLVKSNPTPGYISRVAGAFNNNGAGVRGDMKAVIKAILLDEEARSCDWSMDPTSAKLREPIMRYVQVARGVEKDHIYGRYWNTGYTFMDVTSQAPLGAPSVFNFFLPDYQPVGELTAMDLVGPEYQIHNTKTSVGFINQLNSWVVFNQLFGSWEQGEPSVALGVDDLKKFANDPEVLMNELDIRFCGGQLTDDIREIIKETITPLIWGDYKEERTKLALYLLIMSPDFAVQR